ncbi:MAG: UDP-N-acetylmuramate--L-alanine ligase [Bacilli bacterium]|nr:UDP-N-acetylmuramate--L-alanine ligase [Bacilli bacterium]
MYMYHFVGIKGSGMSALAQIMKRLGYEVQGSDVEKHFFTESGLVELGIPVLPFSADNIKEGMKVVRGASFDDEHIEIKRAKELGVPVFNYEELLGSLTRKFKSITIAGCHGKTTTTSMMAHVFNEIKGANYLIGDGTGFSNKENETFILEACEYKRHFLNYTPQYAIITNIDLDHVDYYKDIDDVIDAYNTYANNAEKMVIACGNDPYTHYLDVKKPIFFYGIDEDNDIIAKNIEYKKEGTSFEVFVEDNYYGFFDLPIYGKHMLLDALAVIAVCYYERFDAKAVAKALKTFKGAKRRFTETIVKDNVVIDDYAHHPNEVKATIKAVKQKYPDKKLVTIFQPHTFSRTKEFAEQFANIMNLADYSYVMDIHPAREKQEDYPDVTSKLILDNLEHGESITIDDSDKLKNYTNTVLLFMSPNDISKLENDTIEKMKED